MANEVINNTELTRADKLYALTGAMLIREAEKLGVKVRKHGNALKESKDSVISKILAKEAELAGVVDEAPEVESVETVSVETESSNTSQSDSDEDEATVEVPKVEADVEVHETEAPASTDTTKKKRTRRRSKKTLEGLVADIPICSANLRFVKSKKNEVHVFLGERRLFVYTGARILTNDETLFAGLDYTEKSYGYKYFCKPTTENFLVIFNNI